MSSGSGLIAGLLVGACVAGCGRASVGEAPTDAAEGGHAWSCAADVVHELPRIEEYEGEDLDHLPPGRTVAEIVQLLARGADPHSGDAPEGEPTALDQAAQQAYARLGQEIADGQATVRESDIDADQRVVRGATAEVRLVELPDGRYLAAGHAHELGEDHCREPAGS